MPYQNWSVHHQMASINKSSRRCCFTKVLKPRIVEPKLLMDRSRKSLSKRRHTPTRGRWGKASTKEGWVDHTLWGHPVHAAICSPPIMVHNPRIWPKDPQGDTYGSFQLSHKTSGHRHHCPPNEALLAFLVGGCYDTRKTVREGQNSPQCSDNPPHH